MRLVPVSAEARVAYVDYDPVVVSHANALLAKLGRSVAVRGDLREPARYAQPHELGGAASESPVGWRVLARKPPARKA